MTMANLKLKPFLFTSRPNVESPTHVSVSGHTLDLLISHKMENLVQDITILRGLPSDHFAVIGQINFSRPKQPKRTILYRKLGDIDLERFKQDIRKSSLILAQSESAADLVDQYNNILRALLDQHAPVRTKVVTVRPRVPWYTDELHEAKSRKRRLERKMLKSGSEIDRQMYKQECKAYIVW